MSGRSVATSIKWLPQAYHIIKNIPNSSPIYCSFALSLYFMYSSLKICKRFYVWNGGILLLFSTRGDAHKLYLKFKKITDDGESLHELSELREIAEMKTFYEKIETPTLEKIYYRILKEKNGMGMIPVFVSAGPWLLFLFSKQLQEFLFKNGSMPFFIFITFYLTVLIISVILHFREKAWASIHLTMIEHILKKRS